MTKETESVIDKGWEILLNQMEQSVSIGVSEDMSPNDIEYNDTLDKEWIKAIEYLQKKLDYYT